MAAGLSCPRCGRINPWRARFCGNCGLSFFSAGLIRERSGAARSGGSGLLAVAVGFMLVFVLVTLLSFAGSALPRHVRFNFQRPAPLPMEQVQSTHEHDCVFRREAMWRFEFPRYKTHGP